MIGRFRAVPSLWCGLLLVFNLTSVAADKKDGSSASVTQPANAASKASGEELTELKMVLANQQRQIEELRRAIEDQKRMLESVAGGSEHARESLGEVASTTPIIPSGRTPSAIPAGAQPTSEPESYPTQLHLGGVTIMPVGFMDFTSVWRTTNPGTGIGSNFGNIPFLNTVTGKNSEFRLSNQNSRIGARIDGDFKGTHVLGYWESDFLGNPTSNNFAVTNHANLLRLRLYWVQLRKDKWELMAGQSWSMLTPGSTGISPLPGDLFYTQDIDVNYQAGLVWSRTPGLRVVYHPSDSWAMGVAFEDPEQSIGGSGGGGTVQLPIGTGATSIATAYATQLNNGGTVLTAPNVMPDIEAKVAYDFKKKFHFEVAGIVREFKAFNPNNSQHYYATGGGGSVNLSFELAPRFRVLTNNYWSDGGGRYIFGLAPDVIVRGDGSLSPVHAASTVDGVEFTTKNTLLYGYYGGVYIGRNVAIDPKTGSPVGYGYSGSANTQNRSIQELTFGFNQTFWKDAKYGAITLMAQYSWLTRNPWFVAAGQPDDMHLSMLFFNLRYTLPGGVPATK
jgi:hypothetical protein